MVDYNTHEQIAYNQLYDTTNYFLQFLIVIMTKTKNVNVVSSEIMKTIINDVFNIFLLS